MTAPTVSRDAQPCRSDVGAEAARALLAVLVDTAPELIVCPRCGWHVGAHDHRRIGGGR